jgi:MFS family permease
MIKRSRSGRFVHFRNIGKILPAEFAAAPAPPGRPRFSKKERNMAVAKQGSFYGWSVVAAAFVLAVFGWGLGFYGPPIYLHAVEETRGWSLALVSSAVTLHFLVGAIFTANLPQLYGRFGVPVITKAGAISLAGGVAGWAVAQEPWQLFVATFFSGAGWIAMSAAAINAILAPWFVRARPAALSMAYNGASVGGVVFSPLWVAAITSLGFPLAAAAIGAVTAVTVWLLAALVFAKTPQQMGLTPDGDAPGVKVAAPTRMAKPLPGKLLWRDAGFLTLAAGMALGLFAQIGLLAHLFSLLVPALGAQAAGLAMGGATAAAVAGRTLVGWMMPASADRRLVAAASYVVQIVGVLALLFAGGEAVALLLLGVFLFGAGIGNATSLPPLIAQVEFAKEDLPRVVALIIAIAQATYAFAPAVFGFIRELTRETAGTAQWMFVFAALVQVMAIAAFLAPRHRRLRDPG